MVTEKKSYGIALILWLFFGGLGAHRIYIKENAVTILWYWLLCICTLSIIVWVDLFRLKGMIQEHYEHEYIKEKAFKSEIN